MLLKKKYSDSYSHAPTTLKKYLNVYFSHSLHQLIMYSTRTTEHSQMLIDNTIIKFSEKKAMQSDIMKMRLFIHELINHSQKCHF